LQAACAVVGAGKNASGPYRDSCLGLKSGQLSSCHLKAPFLLLFLAEGPADGFMQSPKACFDTTVLICKKCLQLLHICSMVCEPDQNLGSLARGI
jgi:hypothetical protein